MAQQEQKEAIEAALLKSMSLLEDAMVLMLILDTKTDRHNLLKIDRAKNKIKKVLGKGYDKQAREEYFEQKNWIGSLKRWFF